MAERVTKKLKVESEDNVLELPISTSEAVATSSLVRTEEPWIKIEDAEEIEPQAAAKPIKEYSPEFLELVTPKLPSLSKANRGRLLMQSPNRLYFYWAVGKNPFHTLNRALGEGASYTLVLKLVNLRTDDEQIHPVDASGNWWFDVDADGEYRAEIGFYAVNRPYIRVLYSNTVATPRKSPSPRSADSAEWRVPSAKFAQVLDAAGFARDAFDVALAGDDWHAAEIATRSAFAQFTGKQHAEFTGIAADEMRYAMLALASGVKLETLRGRISERLYEILTALTDIDPSKAMSVLKERFEFDAEEFDLDEEETGAAVFGSSLVNFPRRMRTRPRKPINLGDLPDLGPLSSHSLLPA